jgi:cytochrome c biogenesis protein
MNDIHQIWKFFASVKLALFTLCTIALTSVIGTLIPQDKPVEFYVEQYGEGMARLFQVLDIDRMYGSWWFLILLGLLCANLIICSIDRIPEAWKKITADQSSVPVHKLEKMPFISQLQNVTSESVSSLVTTLHKQGWKILEKDSDGGGIIAAQKGAWSRTGVYLVHTSILVIFAGAIVGHFFGYKGSVLIPETRQSSKIYAAETQEPIDLGFEVRCDRFDIEFYDNGMPKEYRSRLTVSENGKEMLVKEIEVNHPLQYRGFTFYQSSYQGYRDFLITITDPADNSSETLIVPFQQQGTWPDKNITIGVVNAEAIGERAVRMKVWLKSGDQEPVTFWVDPAAEPSPEQTRLPYTVSVKQMYATGLQVAKDPGVWVVYFGCFMMMSGLYVAFFMSHRRVWLVTNAKGKTGSLMIAGTTNKNRLGFEKTFSDLVSTLSGKTP